MNVRLRMKKPITLIFTFVIVNSTNSWSAQSLKKSKEQRKPAALDSGRFTHPSPFKVVALQGSVVLECSGFQGTVSQTYFCRDQIIDSGNFDYFVGPSNNEGDEVRLSAEHFDGTTRNMKAEYNPRKGQSSEPFNLWVSTLFQKPLLKEGRNLIRWVLLQSRAGKEVAVGQFTVDVERAGSRTCRTKRYQSIDSIDCHNQYSICQRFFSESNYCR